MSQTQKYYCGELAIWKYWRISETQSTNDLAKTLTEEYAVIRADFQKNGRGQPGKTWNSPAAKNILATFKLPKKQMDNCLIFMAAMSVIQTLKKFKIKGYCKWPNDVLTQFGKISGILIEADSDNYYVGIGLNVNWPEQLQFDERNQYTSFFAEGIQVDIDVVFEELAKKIAQIINFTNSKILKFIRENFDAKNKRVLVNYNDDWLIGFIVDINEHAQLIVELINGKQITINSSNQIRYFDDRN